MPQTGGAKRVAVVMVLLLLLLLVVLVMSAAAAAATAAASTRGSRPSGRPRRPPAERIGVAADVPRPRRRDGDRLLLLLLPALLPEGGADVLVVADEGVHRIPRAPGGLLLALGALERDRY